MDRQKIEFIKDKLVRDEDKDWVRDAITQYCDDDLLFDLLFEIMIYKSDDSLCQKTKCEKINLYINHICETVYKEFDEQFEDDYEYYLDYESYDAIGIDRENEDANESYMREIIYDEQDY